MPFLRATNFKTGKFEETIFVNLHWCLVFSMHAIRVTIEYLLIFGETNFVEVHKISSPQKKVSYGILSM